MHKNQDPGSEIQNPASKIQTAAFGIATKKKDMNGYYNNPKSKIQTAAFGLPHKERILQQSKIQNPKLQIRNPKSKIQSPKSKIQTGRPRLDVGFSIWDGQGGGHSGNEDVWPSRPKDFPIIPNQRANCQNFRPMSLFQHSPVEHSFLPKTFESLTVVLPIQLVDKLGALVHVHVLQTVQPFKRSWRIIKSCGLLQVPRNLSTIHQPVVEDKVGNVSQACPS